MLAKLTDNQLTLPDSVMEALGRPGHVELDVQGGKLVVTPRRTAFDDAVMEDVQRDLEARGITEAIIPEAIAWARGRR